MRLSALIDKIPGPEWFQVTVGCIVMIGGPSLHFLYSQQKKPGHGAFDVDKPEAVQQGMEPADKLRTARLSSQIINKNK